MDNITSLSLPDRTAIPPVISHFPVARTRDEVAWALWGGRGARIVILLLVDLAALFGAASAGFLLWAGPILQQPAASYTGLIPLLLLFPLGYAGMGLYPGFGLGAAETLRRLSYCTSFAFLALAAASFVMKLPPHYSRMTVVLAWGGSLFTVPVFRWITLAIVRRREWWGEPAVLIGNAHWIQTTIQALAHTTSFGYRPVGILSSDPYPDDGRIAGVPVLGSPEDAPRLIARGIRVALVGSGERGEVTPSWLQRHFQHVVVVGEYGELPVEQAQVRNLGGVLGVEFTNNLLRWQNCLIKRTLDIGLGSVLLLGAAPFIVLGGLWVKRRSAGPLFFSQERRGLGGQPIKVWKLRTMYQDAEQRLEECLDTDPELRREWEKCYKLPNDPRIIPGVGECLRRWSIDELPQLWNVLKGEMSLVGPRPFPEYHLQQFSREFRTIRQQVRPGITGMWQVTVRSTGTVEEQQAYDEDYIRNWSLWLDIYILVKTAVAVLTGRGAY